MIAIGNSEIEKIYVGNTEIEKAYLGEDLVYSSAPVMKRISYLSFTGTQWIDTNIIPNQNDVIVIIDAYVSGSGNQFLYAIQGSSPYLNVNWYSGQTVYFRYRNYNANFSTTKERHVIENGPDKKIDGVIKASPSYTTSMATNTTKHLVLGGQPNAAVPTSINYGITGYVYSFSVYYGNTCILNMLPVRLGRVGYMYDEISGELFSNNGSGSFGLGNDIT